MVIRYKSSVLFFVCLSTLVVFFIFPSVFAETDSEKNQKDPLGESVQVPVSEVVSEVVPKEARESRTQFHNEYSLDDSSYELSIVETLDYNVFHYVVKAHKEFPIVPSPGKPLPYGPFQTDGDIFNKKYLDLSELDKRLAVLEEDLKGLVLPDPLVVKNSEKQSKGNEVLPPEKDLVIKKTHLADLYALRASMTKKPMDVRRAVAAYTEVYAWVKREAYPFVALNMVNTLLLAEDVVTAFPIIKKISKEFSDDGEFGKRLNASLIELYFIAGRYSKAWSETEKLVQEKMADKQSRAYRIRVGDVLFFLKRYNDAAEWYQQILVPDEEQGFSDNVSWLYFAESLHHLGNEEVSRKIYSAMRGYFEETVYAPIVDFRLSSTREVAEKNIATTSSEPIRNWLQIELLKMQFMKSPEIFTGASFEDLLDNPDIQGDLRLILQAMQAFSYSVEKKHILAVRTYQEMLRNTDNPFLENMIEKAVMANVYKRGMSTQTEDEARGFLRFLRQNEFRMRTHPAEDIYELLLHNLELMGMGEMAAEMTLHIIDKSIHDASDRAHVYLRMANAFMEARSWDGALRSLSMLDEKLIDLSEKEKANRIRLICFEKLGREDDAIALLSEWEKAGASAKNTYWIAIKKVETYLRREDFAAASAVVDNIIGRGTVDDLPPKFSKFVNPLLAYRVILDTRSGRNFEALAHFYADQEKILSTDLKREVLLAGLSSALAINKEEDVKAIMKIAKTHTDEETYKWLAKWASGELWLNQLNKYLDERQEIEAETRKTSGSQ